MKLHMLDFTVGEPTWLCQLGVEDHAAVLEVAVPLAVGALRPVWLWFTLRACRGLPTVVPAVLRYCYHLIG